MPVQRRFSFEVSGAPEEVAQRLRERTRLRPIAWQGSPFGNPSRRPLGGRVSADRFSVGLDRRDWWTLYQAVAAGQLVPTATGTRIEGVAGLPMWVTWLLRFAFVFGMAIACFGAVAPWLEGDPGALAIAPLIFGFVTVTTTLAIGWNVRNADEQVPTLIDTVREAASGSPSPQPEAIPARQPDRVLSRTGS